LGKRPKATPRNVKVDDWAERELKVKRSRSGHLLVSPKINGVDVGWFMFDTGEPMTTISPSLADELGLAEAGHSFVGGAGSEVTRTGVRQAGSLELGPIVLENVRLVEFETMGQETVGVIGWDILIHTVVEIDMQQAAITVHPREDYELRAGEWRDLTLHMMHPHVEASFVGGHEGLFRIDTGAGRLAVMSHEPTVRRFDLLADRETSPFNAMGAGGQLNLRSGAMEWFEIAGHRTEPLPVLFCTDEIGALADGNTLGNIGGGVLTPFVLAFDYQGKRVGFIPRD
jgi:hypothetical protein